MRYGEMAVAEGSGWVHRIAGAGEDELMEEYKDVRRVSRGKSGMRLPEWPAPWHFSRGVCG